MNDVFTRFDIYPSYAAGFRFTWAITGALADPLPWKYVVQEGPSNEGPWTAISPVLSNTLTWSDNIKRVVSKDLLLFFRVQLTTGTHTYFSFVKTPYADVNRREYLIVKDIMRREVLQQDDMAGVQAKLWIRATFGPKCTNCRDPVTGEVSTTTCRYCLGVGRLPPYYGPYSVWATFSPSGRNLELKPDGTGLQQAYTWTVRMIGFPYVKDKDIVLDIKSDKRYIVDGVNNELEIRRVPVIQLLHSMELPVTDPAYLLGTNLEGEEGCVLA